MVTLRFTAYSPDEKGAGGAGHNDPNPAILTDIYAPLTRKEMIQSGMDVDPLTRDEYFLKKQMEQSGGGGSDLPEPFVVHFEFDPKSGKLITREPWSEIATHGKNVVAFYVPDKIYVPLREYTAGAEGEATFRLFVPSVFNDNNMTFSTPVYYRVGVADGAVWGGKYTEASK